MKNEKKLCGFSYYKNIANFEAFWQDKNFSKNLLCLESTLLLNVKLEEKKEFRWDWDLNPQIPSSRE